MQSCGVRRPSLRPSVCLSVNFCANRFFYHRSGWIATKRAHDGPHKSPHPGCAQGQGQGQRSRDTGTSVMSRNVCYTVRSHVLSLHALTLWNTIILSSQYKYQAARCLNIGMSYSVIDCLVFYAQRFSIDFSFSSVVSHLFLLLVIFSARLPSLPLPDCFLVTPTHPRCFIFSSFINF